MMCVYRKIKKGLLIALAVLLVFTAVFGIYAGDYYHADLDAIQNNSLHMDYERMERLEDGSLVFYPGEYDSAVIFYPGGKVEALAYIPLMESLAQEGVLTVLMPMPFNLAVLAKNAAEGIPEEYILPEKESKNTYENMFFSKKLIENEDPEARVIYSTTNYHVFRSGVWASLAGLKAEGIGSKTKWWYWPNAFMRECAGLLARRWWQELVMVAAMALFFGALSVAVI
jgi:hypothetical protein